MPDLSSHLQYPSFLAAVVDAPDDLLPRLIFADWLQENGDDETAEFIRTQIELASPYVCPLSTRPCPECTGHTRFNIDPSPHPNCQHRKNLRKRDAVLMQEQRSRLIKTWLSWTERWVRETSPGWEHFFKPTNGFGAHYVFCRGFVE